MYRQLTGGLAVQAGQSALADRVSTTPIIEIEGLSKVFHLEGKATTALKDVTLKARRGEFVAVVGPSGCGKSSILNLVAGLAFPSAGRIRYDGGAIDGPNTNVGYMTQRDTLLPWQNVESNIALPLRLRGVGVAEIRSRVAEWIQLVGLAGFAQHYPAQLSGGMRRRVTMARTLIYEPETLLMDEPFGALDAQLRLILQGELLRIWERTRQTIVFVTHDLEEAIGLADTVVVMSARPGRARLSQPIPFGRPRDIIQLRRTQEFGNLFEQLWRTLEQEFRAGTEV